MAGKRKDHEGTYFKETRGSTVYFGWKIVVDGKPVVRKRQTAKDLETAKKKVLADLERKGFLEPAHSDLTVKQRLTHWLENKIKPPGRAWKTYESYRDTCNNHIFPAIGKIRMSKLSSMHVEQLIRAVREKKLSERSAQYAVVVLCAGVGKRKSLDIKEDVDLPSGSKPRDRILEVEEITEILQECGRTVELKTRPGEFRHQYRDRFLIGFLLNSGLRIGEAIGILAVRINHRDGSITIDRQLERSRDEDGRRKWELSAPKTTAGDRSIYLSEESLALVKEQMAMIAADKVRVGGAYEDNGLLFCTESGKPHHARNVYDALMRILAAVNARRTEEKRPLIEHCSIHDLRRSYLTHLADVEDKMQVVAAIAGHASISTTHKYYVRARERRKKEASVKISFGLKKNSEADSQAG